MIEPSEADKRAAADILGCGVTVGSTTPESWVQEELKRQQNAIVVASRIIAQYMAPERVEHLRLELFEVAAKDTIERLTAELGSTRSLLFDIEVALVNDRPGCHPECDKGVCTHPLKLVRQALAETRPKEMERLKQ